MQRSRKLSHSGFKIPELYAELESALPSGDLERACCLTAELACTAGGQTRGVVCFLIDTYCARCVNSGRAQLNLLDNSLAHLGDGTSRSPNLNACHDEVFRRGLCTLTMLVACACACTSSQHHDVGASFARVPRWENLPTLQSALDALRASTVARDPHTMSSVIRAAQDQVWFMAARKVNAEGGKALSGSPHVQRLRASARRDAVWELWGLASELSKDAGVSEYVDNCIHAFSWGYTSRTPKLRIHLLWYAFLVIVKGATRAGPHPILPDMFERALLTIDGVFDDILFKRSGDHVVVEVDDRLGYLCTITRLDPSKAWAVEKDREEARKRVGSEVARCVDLGLWARRLTMGAGTAQLAEPSLCHPRPAPCICP